MFTFTPDQQMALDYPGNVIVSAGAGSGKTRVLVEKYFRLLVDEHPDWPVDAVVAITFTRKAAAELKSRIIKRVLGELEQETEDGPRRRRLVQLRNDVGAAPIGTIHNFCGRILKEFSFDAHLNPDFVVVEGAQEGALRMKAAQQAIAVATSEKGTELYSDLLGLLNVMSAIKLTGILAGMLSGRTAYMKPAESYVGSSLDELFEKLHEFHASYVNDLRRTISADWTRMLTSIDRAAQPGKVKDVVSTALASWPDDPVGDWWVCDEQLQNVYGLLTTNGTCRKVEFRKAGFDDDDPIRAAFEELADRCKKARLADLNENDREDLALSRRLARLFLKALEIYGDLRGGDEESEADMVDYADLELMAEKLVLENAQIRRQIRDRYKFLIVDEFQDTSESQWNILHPLVNDEKGKPRPGCLFVVGDRKQGVYGFREANVSLFSQVEELVTTHNEDWMGCSGRVSMAANFRTLETPLTFINKVFERLLQADESGYSVEFEALQVMKDGKGDNGCVEFLLCGNEEPEVNPDTGKPVTKDADEKREDEADLVAAHVARLVNEKNVKPGDIALLFRKRAVFSVFEDALRQRGIPVVTQQGFNLFHQPELADTIAALKSVVYPHRDLVLVHFLRSPIVGFTDDLLLKIARTRGRSFWDKACRVHEDRTYRLDDKVFEISEQEFERLDFALTVLRDTRAKVGLVSPYAVVKQMIDRLGLRTIVQASYRGEQAVANIDKLLAIARSSEFISFEEFLEYVENEGQSDNGMAEAVDLTTADAVKIMTIHAAKGLEFPVVYLPDLNSGTSGAPRTTNGDGENWMTIRLPREQVTETSFLMDYFKTRDEQQSAAEERRVFYVAMTRCEKHLVLSANCDKSRVKNTFYSWITGEFAQGRLAGALYTKDDFEPAPHGFNEKKSSNPITSFSREARIEAALRAANVFAEAPVSSQSKPESRTGNAFLDALPLILPLLIKQGEDVAKLDLHNNPVFAGTDAKELEQWSDWVSRISGWVAETFPEQQSLRIMSRLSIYTESAGMQKFVPHVAGHNTCGWIIPPGPAGQMLLQDVEQYRSATADVPGALEVQVLKLEVSPSEATVL